MRDLRIDALKKLRDIVIQLKVIKIELDNEEDAHIIFETLNTRGQDLTLSDLIKNSLGALVSKAGDVDVFKEMWKNLNANLTNCGAASKTDSFFLHSWSSRFTPVTKQKAFRAFKKRIADEMDQLQADERTVGLSHLSAFKDDSRRYLTISAPEGNWKKFENIVEDSLLALRLFNVEQQTPFVLSLLRAYDEKKVSYKMLRRALCSVENFHFQFNAITSSRSSGSIASMYSRFAKGLYEAPDRTTSALIIDDAITELRGRLPSIEEFTVSFKQLSYNTLNRSNALLRYVLLKLAKAELLSHDVDSTLLTIEHIRSQSAVDDQWKEDKINGIGNLFLLSEARNLKVQNKEFLDKKVLFQSWHQSIPAYILEQDDWTPELSEQRAATMAETAYRQVWRI